jgi:GTPase SAR1 family protein
MKKWIEELKKHGPKDIILVIAGNKCDLPFPRVSIFKSVATFILNMQYTVDQSALTRHQQEVSTDAGDSYAKKEGALFAETSARDDTNVTKLFEQIIPLLPSKTPAPTSVASVSIGDELPKSGCGC